jgi:DNA-binding transcriptional ArsR family regulator
MQVFDAIAHPKRREILRMLAERERSAGEVASHFSITQPAISQHLKVLKTTGLVNERRDGTRRIFSVRAEGLNDLNDFLADVLPASVKRLKKVAEAEERKAKNARRVTKN